MYLNCDSPQTRLLDGCAGNGVNKLQKTEICPTTTLTLFSVLTRGCFRQSSILKENRQACTLFSTFYNIQQPSHTSWNVAHGDLDPVAWCSGWIIDEVMCASSFISISQAIRLVVLHDGIDLSHSTFMQCGTSWCLLGDIQRAEHVYAYAYSCPNFICMDLNDASRVVRKPCDCTTSSTPIHVPSRTFPRVHVVKS